ncbi:MAG: PBP1A family penicillin-binding protein [Myxococcota bacterium]
MAAPSNQTPKRADPRAGPTEGRNEGEGDNASPSSRPEPETDEAPSAADGLGFGASAGADSADAVEGPEHDPDTGDDEPAGSETTTRDDVHRPPDDATPTQRPRGRVWVTNRTQAGFFRYLLRFTLYFAFIGLLALAGVGVGLYRWFAADLPPVEAIEQYSDFAPGVTRIYARGGAMLAELAREHRAYAPYEEVPEDLVHAVLAAEDRRFFTHGGLDYRGLARAALANYRAGTVSQGGSTITQQVAKGFLTDEQTLTRKIREAILSVRMETHLPKEDILEIYLNKIFLGHGAYGVASAASRYFGKELDELTLAECALIAGLARAPSRYSPVSSPERAKKRRAVVLQDMVEAGYIDAAQRDAANAEPIELVRKPDVFRARAPHYAEHVRQWTQRNLGEDAVLTDGLQIETAMVPFVQREAEAAVDRAVRKLDRKQGFRGPVATLSEPDAAVLLERTTAEYGPSPVATRARWRLGVVQATERNHATVAVGATQTFLPIRGMKWAAKYDRNSGINGETIDDVRKALEVGDVIWVRRAPDKFQERPAAGNSDGQRVEVELGQTPRVEAALYTAEHPTGYVEAIQGGHDYDRSQFNRPVQGCRQPGSVFKAIYYAYALDTGKYTMGSMLEDHAYEPDPGEEWNPQNIHGTLEGQVLLRNAFIHSLNLPSIRLFQRLGADNVVRWARTLGFTTKLIADKALSLGASCVQMDEMSRAFGIYVSEGKAFEPVYVRRVTNKRGEVVLDQRHVTDGAMDLRGRLDAMGRAGTAPPEQRIDRRSAFLITQMLRDVVTSGIGRRAQRIGVPAGGKSGTASKHAYTTDTWFVGFTSRYVTAAWMGDDEYERSMGDEEASYTTATPLWADYMEPVVEGLPHGPVPLERPPGIRSKSVEFMAGEKQRVAPMYFKAGTGG